jgi:GT2 family glycosyltransferase
VKTLIPGLKRWPYHHEVEHLLAEALQAAGHPVVFMGCSQGGMSACECVDRAIHERHGGHAAFCAGCHPAQGGVHGRAGFREVPMPFDEAVEGGIRLLLEGLDAAALLALPTSSGHSLREVMGPSLMRWARSGRPSEERVPLAVLRGHAAQVLRMEALLPELLRREGIEQVLVLNGLFLAERAIAACARAAGLRVVTYERGHARNTLLFSTGAPACFLEIGADGEGAGAGCPDPLLDAYLAGRASNRDAATRFGTGHGSVADILQGDQRPLVAVLTNVCWDSAVSARGSGFGGYLDWLEAVLALAAGRPELSFVLRVHPGETRLERDPTLDRTEDWLAERARPDNLLVLGADHPASTATLVERAAATLVYVTSAGLEAACAGAAVITCGEVHYAGKGFTLDCAEPARLGDLLDEALARPRDEARAALARTYAGRLFLDTPTPFPWVDEVEYGRPQRVTAPVTPELLARDPLLRRLVDYLTGAALRPHSLRDLLERPALCPLPFHFGSRPASPTQVGVLITAHERPAVLGRALAAWADQDLPHDRFHLLVVDDGSEPRLEEPVREALAAIRRDGTRLEVELLRLDTKGGPARARNAGIEHFLAQEQVPGLVLITGDDMLPEPGVLSRLTAEHAAWGDGRVALLGRVDWDDSRGSTRVMRLVARNGMQFGFHGLPARCRLPAQYFYTSSLALPTDFLRRTGLRFAEDFPHAAWEDVEFGVRCREQGLVLAYDAGMRFRHDHPVDYASFARRQRKAGASSRVFQRRSPREHEAICGKPPAEPPDRLLMRGLEAALQELAKLELGPLRILPAPGGGDLAGQLDREQDRLLETLFRLHSDAGWFSAAPLPEGPGEEGLLSVLIPVLNQMELTRACLEALRRNTAGPVEIVVVDNGSTDGSGELLAAAGVTVLRQERNLGFARATNLAAAACRGSLLVLLNNDTEVQPGWDLVLRDELGRPRTGAVGLRLLYPDGTVQHAGLVFGADGLPWHVYRGFPADAPEVNRRRTFQALTGACLGLRRDAWREVGGLDENFVNCYEDIDLCLRLRERGYELIYRPDGVVVHHEGRSAGRNERVAHSWQVLRERWEGRLPWDEVNLLAEDGWQAVREQGGLRLRRIAAPAPRLAADLTTRAEALMAGGDVSAARDLLEEALSRGGVDRPEDVRQALLELELRVGNLAGARRWAEQCQPRPEQQARLSQLRHDLRRRLEDNGLSAAP